MNKIIKMGFIITIVLQGIAWLLFGAFNIITYPDYLIIAVLMLINGVCFFGIAFVFDKKLIFKIGTIIFIIINLVLTLTDQMGLFDYIILIFNILSLVSCLYLYRSKR